MKFLKEYTFPIFFVANVFVNELFGCYMVLNGITVVSGMLQQLYIVISLIAYCIFAKDFTQSATSAGSKRILWILSVVLLLMVATQFFYDQVPYDYTASILCFGSICIASTISGAHQASVFSFDKIDKTLPFFIVPIGIVISTFGYVNALVNGIVQTGSGLDYQNVAYYCAEMVAYCGYYLLFSSVRGTHLYGIL